MIKFWQSGSRIQIRIARLVRRALAEIYTISVLLVRSYYITLILWDRL